MNSERKYKNPPIGEAVCEIRIVPSSPWDLAVPGLVYDQLRASFPKRRQVKAVQATLMGGAVRTEESERLQLLQADEKTLVTVAKDTISISRLKPYLGWETFRPVILDAFKTYGEITSPTGFQRIGLRYINQLNFKEDTLPLEDFFEFYPFVGKQLPQIHTVFFVGIQVPYHEGRDALRLQLATADAPDGFRLSFNLDLDYFLVDSAKVPVPALREWLEEAHFQLAAIFEGCLKDAMRARLQEAEQK